MTGAVAVKVCCIASVEEARLAVRHGASAIGLVSEMPSGPGVIAEPLIAEIAASAPPGIGTFLLTCRTSVDGIVQQQRRTRVSTIQICDDLAEGAHRHLKAALPGISLVQVIHVGGEEALARATGGLRADNVAEAIATVAPFALDVCSGVRTEGRLDPARLEAFFAAVRAAA